MYSVMNVALSTTVAALLLLAVIVLPKQGIDLPVLNITGGQVEILRLSSLAPERRLVFEKRLTFIAGILLVAALWWLYREGRRALDARFYRGSLDYKRALTAFSKLSHSHSDPASLARAVVSDVVKLLHVRGALFALRDNGGFIPTAVHRLSLDGDGLVFDRADAESLQTALARAPVQAVDNLALRERFASRGAEFIVGVPLEGRIEALLLLGEKESDTNYSREDVELLENLAINIADSLLTMRFYDGAREKERLRKELEIARQIQMQSLPAELPDFPGIAVAAESIPAYEVGGDFYDVLPRHDSATFLLGDVSGKGTSAALYLARLQGILKTIESFQPTLWELIVRLNTLIFDHLERRSFISVAALRVDFLSSNVHFIRAGHLPLLHYNALAREVHEYRPAGMAIGLDLHSFTSQLEEQTIFSRAGDVFVLVSDGVTEAADEAGAQFGIDGVAACLAEHAAQSPRDITASIIQAVRAHAVAEQDDDITILVLKCSISAGQ
jgi:serine phosphatase RsbU (regulator of sigma subunit)